MPAQIPRTAKITMLKNVGFQGRFTITDSAGSAVDISDWVIRGGLWDSYDSSTVAAIAECSIVTGASGIFSFSFTATQLATVSIGRGFIDFLFKGPAGIPLPLARTPVDILEGLDWGDLT